MQDTPLLFPAHSYLQDTAHDIRCYFGVWRVLIFSGRLQVVLQARLPESHEGFPVLLDGLGLPDGSGDTSDADFHHSLVVVVGLVVLVQIKTSASERTSFIRPHKTNQKA